MITQSTIRSNTRLKRFQWSKRALTLACGMPALWITTAYTENINLSHVKMADNLQPNVLLMIDDSGSMDWEIMTSGQWILGSYIQGLPGELLTGDGNYISNINKNDATCDNRQFTYLWTSKDQSWDNECFAGSIFSTPEYVDSDWRILSHKFNTIYYNPSITYTPWPGYPDADFSKARSHPDHSQQGYTLLKNLGTSNMRFVVWHDTAGFSGHTPSPTQATQVPNGIIDLWDNFTYYEVNNSNITVKSYQFKPNAHVPCNAEKGLTLHNYLDCFNGAVKTDTWNAPFGRSIAQEQRNIANWYQYHRKRSYALRNVVARLIHQFPDFRYALDFTKNYNNTFIETPHKRDNLQQHNQSLMKAMFEYTQKHTGTPLAAALDRAGQYFEGKLRNKPSPIEESCQANYTLMLTDGFWNDQKNYSGVARGDLDKDGAQNNKINTTLADIATYYFTRDLMPDMINNFSKTKFSCESVPIPKHQHMSTIGVTFGPFGNLKARPDGCWPEGNLTTNSNWGNPLSPTSGASLLARVDDLWHAAFNSNGFFTSSSEPQVLLNELSETFGAISQLDASGAQGTLASSRLNSDNAFIISSYDTSNNTGILKSYWTDPETGTLNDNSSWSTDDFKGANRYTNGKQNVFSFNPETKKGMSISSTEGATQFTQNQRATLFPRLNRATQITETQAWLDELTLAPLGATTHSNPTFVGQPTRSKTSHLEKVKKGYAAFKESQKSNLSRDMIYIGSNRGFLHGLDMKTGQEVFRYLPDAMIDSNLPLAHTAYSSKVDGQIVAEDVYFTGQKKWRTVIVAGFRYGATGYFALDVTDPDQFTSAKGSQAVLWEYSNQGTRLNKTINPNLGYSYSKAGIGRMANGQWVAAFGNGYNSQNEQASIIIVDIETGELIHELKTGRGTSNDPLNQQRANGMSEPALVDENQDGIVDVIYAGDLYGNLYAFDVTATSASQWASKYGTASKATPLYATKGAPITSRPAVIRATDSQYLMVIVGTGQSITTTTKNEPHNSLVGVIDQGRPVNSTSQLQTIELISSTAGWSIKPKEQSKNTTYAGWHIPLTGSANGYTITDHPHIELGELSVLLTKSSEEVCKPNSATSVILKMNPLTGGSLNRILFLQENGQPIGGSKNPIDGLVIEGALLNGMNLATNGSNGTIISNSAQRNSHDPTHSGIQEIKTTYPPHSEGRQRYRRLYD